MALITYNDKVALNENPSIADINKVKASDMNEIKSVVNGLIVNSSNNSTTNTYSCDYSNNVFGGKLLWKNQNPTSTFAAQNILLSSSDYDVLEIFYSISNNPTQIKSTKALKGKNFVLDFYDGYSSKGAIRPVNYTNDTTLSVSNSFYNSSTGSATYCIPLYIIGYKSNLFS